MDAKPKTVTVESIKWHTHDGKAYPIGTAYEIEAHLLESVIAQGMAVRKADAPAPAKK